MSFPEVRMRRLRANSALRDLVRETSLEVSNLVMPMFVVPGSNVRRPISSMPGILNLSIDQAVEEAGRYVDAGLRSVLLFGIPEKKDDTGSDAWSDDGIIPQTIRALKKARPELLVITDLCFCEYTSHGHCGVMKDGVLDNDATLDIIEKQTLAHARAGADMVAPSGMIDGAVGVMRHALDEHGFSQLPIMAYAAKFASGFYGPFREAAQCAPQFGDRRSYQMDPRNRREALREVELDIAEGADIVMIKPALAFMDIIREVKDHFPLPVAAYNVSGEYAMVKAAGERGWIDEERVMLETLFSLRRAGADIIISYFAAEVAAKFRGGRVSYE